MTDSRLQALLQQHFNPDTPENAAPLHKAAALLRQWLGADRALAYPTTPLATLAQSFDEHRVPAQGMSAMAYLALLEHTVLPNTAQLNHPKYIGHMTQALPWVTLLAETVAAALNQNQVKVETAYISTLIEKQVLGWLHRQVYGNDDAYYAQALQAHNAALGNFVSGGTLGNLTALAVALEHQLPGTRARGLFATLREAGYSNVAVLASARAHYSMKKALATLGLGEQALHLVPVDRDNRIDLAQLETRVAQLQGEGCKILAVVGICGTTETGAIDPLAELAALARRVGAWFHVDAAWGGALLLSARHAAHTRGIEQADSVVMDGHKLMWVPMPQSMVLFRDAASLNNLKHHANYVLRNNSGDLGQTSLEGSRRFDALKLWTALKVLGGDGYGVLLDHAAALSTQMAQLLREDDDFELMTVSDAFILTYRYAPRALRQRLHALLADGAEAQAAALNAHLNTLNRTLQTRQKEAGRSFVSRTVLESTTYPGDTVVLRVVLTNATTEARHLAEILDEQRALGATLLAALPD